MEALRMYEAFALEDSLGNLVYPGSVELTRDALVDTLNAGHYGIANQIGHGSFYNMSVGDDNFQVSHADALVNGDHQFLIYALN